MNAPKATKNGMASARPRRIEGSETSDGAISGAPPRRSIRRSTAIAAAPAIGREREQHPDPGRPAERAALGQRDQQGDQRHAEQRGAGQVDPGRLDRSGGRDKAARQRQHGQPDRDVDQEDRPPGQAPQVGLHQRAAEQLADGRADAAHRGVQGHGPGPTVPVERGVDGGEHLRLAHRRRQALEDPERDQRADARGQPAEQRADREAGHADHEHPAAADRVAEAAADHQHQRVGDAVAGHDELQHRTGGVQRGTSSWAARR